MVETQPLLRIPDQAYGARGIPVPQGAFELHQHEQGPVNGPLPLEAIDLAKHALTPDTPKNFIHGPINIFPGEAVARRVAAAVGGAIQRFPQAFIDSASITLTGAPTGVDVNDPRLGRVVTAGATAITLAACGAGAVQPPTRPIEVTRAATAIVVPPNPTSIVEATRTAIPPTAEIKIRPSATPDLSINPVKPEANVSMAETLSQTVPGKLFLARVDNLAGLLKSNRAFVLANLDVKQAVDPKTNLAVYVYANVNTSTGFGDTAITQGLDNGALFGPNFKFDPKPGATSNDGYPTLKVDGVNLVVSTALAQSVVSDTVVAIIRPDFNAKEYVALSAKGEIVARAPMDIESSPIRKDGRQVPYWKAEINFLSAATATAEASATPEVKHMQAMRLTDNVSVLPDKKIITTTNAQPLIDALRKSNPEAEKILNGLYYLSVTALMDKNPNPTEARVTEVQAQIEAARKAGKPFYIEEKVQDIAGWDKDGRPLFQTASEAAAKLSKIDLTQPVIVSFEEESDMQARLKRGGTGSVDGRHQVAVDNKGNLYINNLITPNILEGISRDLYSGNRQLMLALQLQKTVATSFFWASDELASEAPLVIIPSGFTQKGQAPMTNWNIANDASFKR